MPIWRCGSAKITGNGCPPNIMPIRFTDGSGSIILKSKVISIFAGAGCLWARSTANAMALRLKNKVGIGSSFFYDINQTKKKFDTYRVLKATPYANSIVADMAERLVREEKLGVDNDADLLSVSFSCLDYMNRDFAVYAPEFKDVVIRLDRDIERLLAVLDSQVGRENYTVFLTFSETREILPEELDKMNIGSGYFSIFKAVAFVEILPESGIRRGGLDSGLRCRADLPEPYADRKE